MVYIRVDLPALLAPKYPGHFTLLTFYINIINGKGILIEYHEVFDL